MSFENRSSFARCSRKENPTKLKQCEEAQKKLTSNSVPRNPLADLHGNALLKITNVLTTRNSVSTITCIESCQIKTRAISMSDVETRVKYYRRFDKVTERRSDKEEIYTDNDDEVFVDSYENFTNFLAEGKRPESFLKKSVDKIEQPLSGARQVPVTDVKKPAKKVTVGRRSRSRQNQPSERTHLSHESFAAVNDLFKDCFYDSDYFQENYRYMLKLETRFVFRKSYLKKNVDEHFRMVVVNWLSSVQQMLDCSEAVFFVTVRMFDYLLISSKIDVHKYTLVGITTLWIVNKHLGVLYIKVSKLLLLCNGKFSKQDIIAAEKEILKAVKFNINFPEPVTFLYYYLVHENVENDEIIRYSAMFLLEVFTLLLAYSSSFPSILASAALYIVLVKYKKDHQPFLSYIKAHLLEEDIFKGFAENLENSLKPLLKCATVSSEIVSKYSTPDKCCVAGNFTE